MKFRNFMFLLLVLSFFGCGSYVASKVTMSTSEDDIDPTAVVYAKGLYITYDHSITGDYIKGDTLSTHLNNFKVIYSNGLKNTTVTSSATFSGVDSTTAVTSSATVTATYNGYTASVNIPVCSSLGYSSGAITTGTSSPAAATANQAASVSGDVIIPSYVSISGTVYKIVSIPAYAFARNLSITSIVIPDTVTSIGAQSFDGCTALKNVTFSNTLTSISDKAFTGCTALTSVVLPSTLTTLNAYAFRNTNGLTSLTLPSSITTFGSAGYIFSLSAVGTSAWKLPNLTTVNIYADLTVPTDNTNGYWRIILGNGTTVFPGIPATTTINILNSSSNLTNANLLKSWLTTQGFSGTINLN